MKGFRLALQSKLYFVNITTTEADVPPPPRTVVKSFGVPTLEKVLAPRILILLKVAERSEK